jgi:hypothetical protein
MPRTFNPHIAQVEVVAYKTRTLPLLLFLFVASLVLLYLGFLSDPRCIERWGDCQDAAQLMVAEAGSRIRCRYCGRDKGELCLSDGGCGKTQGECVCRVCTDASQDTCSVGQCFRDGDRGVNFNTWCIQTEYEWARPVGIMLFFGSVIGIFYVYSRLIKETTMLKAIQHPEDYYGR